MVGQHHGLEAAAVDSGIGNFLQVRCMGGDAEETSLAGLHQAVEGFVQVFVHESVDAVAGMHMGDVNVVGFESAQGAFNGCHVVGD